MFVGYNLINRGMKYYWRKNIIKQERRDLFSLEISCISRNVTGREILSLLVDNFAIIEVKTVNTFFEMRLLLFFSGDVETNPGPPKNKGPPGGRPKEPSKEEIMAAMKQKESGPWLLK